MGSEIDVMPEGNMLLIENIDVPGVIGKVGKIHQDIKTSNIGFISFYNLDYWHHYKVVMRMFEGLINLNPEVFYNIHPFFHYGTPVFLVYLFFSLPFMILEYDSMVIFTYKMVILFFALMSVTYLYFFSRLYLNKISSLLICTI